MEWERHRQALKDNQIVQFRPKGNSMVPTIKSGQLVTVSPIADYSALKKGDVVFCKVKSSFYVHLISAINNKVDGIQFQISNNRGRVNGWISESQLFGKVTSVAD